MFHKLDVLQWINLMGTTDLYIFGASGHGKVIFDAAVAAGYNVAAFIDDNKAGETIRNRRIIQLSDIEDAAGVAFALGIGGDNYVREKVAERILNAGGGVLPVIMHPSAVVSPDTLIGEGTVIMSGVMVNSGSEIGRGVILNTGCIIEHDNKIGDFAHISPGATLAGTVTIGAYTHMGIGCCARQGVSLGCGNIVGAGAVVVSDFNENNTIVGVPAKILKRGCELDKIFLSPPHMSGGKELEYVKDVFDSNYIAPRGDYLDKFESAVKSYTGAKKMH